MVGKQAQGRDDASCKESRDRSRISILLYICIQGNFHGYNCPPHFHLSN
jgi:hypothetical protein